MDQDLFYVSQKEAVSLPKENKQAQKLLLQAYIAFCFVLENSTLGILCLKRISLTWSMCSIAYYIGVVSFDFVLNF